MKTYKIAKRPPYLHYTKPSPPNTTLDGAPHKKTILQLLVVFLRKALVFASIENHYR